MISRNDAQTVISNGGHVLSADGRSIGKVRSVYLDDQTGEPAWVSVSSGLLDSSESFVPVSGGRLQGNHVWVPRTRETINGAPRVRSVEGRLSREDDAALHRYYDGEGRTREPEPTRDEARSAEPALVASRAVSPSDQRAPSGGRVRTDASGGSGGGDAVIRAEERLRIDTENVPVTRVRMRKVVVTETVTQTVPVSHEEFRLEEVPIGEVDGDDVVSEDDLNEDYEVVLRAEQLVVSKEITPVELVRVRVESVPGERRVSADLQKERVVTDETRSSEF